METLVQLRDLLVLITTASDRHECQMWDWWDQADVIIYVQEKDGHFIKGGEVLSMRDVALLGLIAAHSLAGVFPPRMAGDPSLN